MPRVWTKVTVLDEMRNRDNCRVGLPGVLVAVGGKSRDTVRVSGSHWEREDKLAVQLADGRWARPDDLVLAEPWPMACCQPGHWHAFNRRTPAMKAASRAERKAIEKAIASGVRGEIIAVLASEVEVEIPTLYGENE